MFRKGLIGLASSAVLISSAYAADMSAAPEGGYKDYGPGVMWSGFYIGANGGYAWQDSTSSITVFNNAGTVITTKGFNAEGGFGGGQVGRNWQYGALVLGVEADIQGSGISDSFNNRLIDGAGDRLNAHTSLDFFGTVRGRAGYAFNQFFVYGTAGLAYGGLTNHLFVFGGGASADLKQSVTEIGVAVGGGVEYAINPRWSVKAEYQFLDFSHGEAFSAAVVPANGVIIHSNGIGHEFNTARIGVNYHIGSIYEPLK
jgi:outer membrane immunogenic protein